MRLQPFRSEVLAAVVAAAVVSACIIALFDIPPRSSAVDDWRRTANGWERSAHWHAANVRSPNVLSQQAPARRRYDTHPAVIALAQLTAALLALSAFPARRQSVDATPIAWPTQIARSFRASAFGS